MKLELWEQKVGQGRLDIFENLFSAVTSQNVTRSQELVQEQLSSLKKEFLSYFPDLSLLHAKLIRSPFTVDASSVPDDIQDEFVDLINDSTAKKAYETLSLVKFLWKTAESYPLVSPHFAKSFLVFPSTYLCEQGLSSLCLIKTKHCARLAVEASLRVALSKTVP